MTFRVAGEVQGVGEVGDADGIRYWPVVAGNSLKLVKSLDAGGGREADDVHFLARRPETAMNLSIFQLFICAQALHRHPKIPRHLNIHRPSSGFIVVWVVLHSHEK